MSTDESEAAWKFAQSLSRLDRVQGPARGYIERLCAEVDGLSDALVERDLRIVRARLIVTNPPRMLGQPVARWADRLLLRLRAVLDGDEAGRG